MSTATTTPGVFQGKYGFYPVSYETFLKLKAINKAAERAKRQKATWDRWERKEPHNRVVRAKIRNSQRQVVGHQPPVPQTEPGIDNVFLTKKTIQTPFDHRGVWHARERFDREVVEFTGGWVADAYRQARFPVATEGEVNKLSVPQTEIDRLYALVRGTV